VRVHERRETLAVLLRGGIEREVHFPASFRRPTPPARSLSVAGSADESEHLIEPPAPG
jgi:hypothetical protein